MPTRPSKSQPAHLPRTRVLVQAIRLGLTLGAGVAALPAYALTCPGGGSVTVSGPDSLTSSCVVSSGGSIAIDNVGSLTHSGSGTVLSIYGGAALNNAGGLTNTGNAAIHTAGALNNQTGGTLNNNAVIDVLAGGTLTNDGALDNAPDTDPGEVIIRGTFTGTGSVNNSFTSGGTTHSGDFRVLEGNATVANSPNFVGGTLSGDWEVDAGLAGHGGTSASLAFGNGTAPLTRIAADGRLELLGADAQFDHIGTNTATNLTDIAGALVLQQRTFTNQAGNTLNVAYGGSLSTKYGATTNAGTLNNGGGLLNAGIGAAPDGGILFGGGTLVNGGTLNNTGTLYNIYVGSLTNEAGRTLDNTGGLVNGIYGTLTNAGTLINRKDGASDAILANNATFEVTRDGEIQNHQDAVINNAGAFNLAGDLVNYTGGTLDNSGSLHVQNHAYGGGSLDNHATLVNRNGATLTDSWALNNYGTLTNESGGTLTLTTAGQGWLGNYGTLNNQAGGTLNIESQAWLGNYGAGTVTNGGTLNVAGTLHSVHTITNAGDLNVAVGGVVSGTGTLTQTAGTLRVDGGLTQAELVIQGGTLQGTGTVTTTGGLTIASGATLAPGNSPGTLTINGDLSLGGTLNIEILGTTAGTYDVLDVHGLVDFGLASLVSFDLSGLGGQSVGMTWDFLLADDPFANLGNLQYSITGLGGGLTYHVSNVSSGGRHGLELVLDSAAVPEPAGLSLLGLGGLLLARFRRRRTGATV